MTLHHSHSHYLNLCERTLNVRGFPCGKRARWSSLKRRPTDLAQRTLRKLSGHCQEFSGSFDLMFLSHQVLFDRTRKGGSARKDNRGAKIWNCGPRSDGERTGRANPESERAA